MQNMFFLAKFTIQLHPSINIYFFCSPPPKIRYYQSYQSKPKEPNIIFFEEFLILYNLL
jgi:hypothetical protein